MGQLSFGTHEDTSSPSWWQVWPQALALALALASETWAEVVDVVRGESLKSPYMLHLFHFSFKLAAFQRVAVPCV